MKAATVICFLGLAAVALAGKPGEYTDRYDNVNLDELLSNRRLLIPYIKCILDQGKCSPDGKELKAHIKEALEENCRRCTAKQQEGARRVLAHLINNEPDYWLQIVNKYDPQRKFMQKYEADLKQIKG